MKNTQIKTMSPHEYLEYLQRKEYGGYLPAFAADVGDVLTASLIASLPQEHRAQLGQIAIGVLPTKSINAWVEPVPSGGEVIGFDFGTMSFLIALNKVLLSRITVLGFEPTMEYEVAARRARSIIKSFFGEEEFPRWPVSPRRLLISSSLSNVQTAFIVGHELGHVLLGHLKEPYFNEVRAAQLQEMEFRADERGGELALASFRRTHDPISGTADTTLAQAGVDIFMTYMIFMSRILGEPVGTHTSSHPSWEARRDKLRARYSQEMTKDAQLLSSMAEDIFEGFVDVLEAEEEAAQKVSKGAKAKSDKSSTRSIAASANKAKKRKIANGRKTASKSVRARKGKKRGVS